MLGTGEHLSGEYSRTHHDGQAPVPTLLIEGNVSHLMFKNHMDQWRKTIPSQQNSLDKVTQVGVLCTDRESEVEAHGKGNMDL